MNLERKRLPLTLVITLSLLYSVNSWSQVEEISDEEIEEVVVTGSHIKGTPEDAPLPVTTLSRDDLSLEGTPTILDLVKNLSFSQGADGETDQFQAGSFADRATVNLRGFGPSRSLVLVNGQRTTWSPHAIPAQAQLLVDINAIPSTAIERIEVLRDGAAATYGSDAIAGVMNFITRSDFVGLEVSANHKMIEASDGDNELGIIWGSSLSDEVGHLVSSFSYISRGRLPLSEREWAVLPFAESPTGGWSSIGRPAVIVPLQTWNGLSAAGLGGFTGLLLGGIVDPNCDALGGTRTTVLPQNPNGGFCRFQYTAFDNLAEETQRWQWFTELTWQLGESTTFSADLLLSDSHVPEWGTSPSYPPNRLVDDTRTIRANNPGLIDMASKYPDLYGNLAACDAEYCRYQGDPTQNAQDIPLEWQEVAWFYGRTYGPDGPLRDHPWGNDLKRLSMSLDGSRGERDWSITTTYSMWERSWSSGDTMIYRDARARQGLGGFECERTVPNEYDADGNLSFSLETLMRHAGQGSCSYWIPFSNSMPSSHPQVQNGTAVNSDFNPSLNNRDLFEYMVNEMGGTGETSLFVLEGVLSGPMNFELDGGQVDYAVGAHWRRESYESAPWDINNFDLFPCSAGPEIKDCTIRRNGLFGFLPPSTDIDESRNIYALFGELNLPLTSALEGQLSLRFEDYGGATGTSLDPKAAIRFQATPSIAFRASVGTTFRGPTLNQTVADDSSNSLQFVAATGAFKRVDTKGNPNLEPEEATTLNFGLLIDHDDLIFHGDNLFGTVDYWSYDFEKPLVTEPFGAVLGAACPTSCDETNPYFPRLAFGGPPAATNLEIIDVFIINGPDIKTTGVDFSIDYEFGLGSGMMTVGTSGTRILGYEIDAWVLGEAYDALGSMNYGTSFARSLVEWKGRTTLNYAMGALNARYNTNYIDEYEVDTSAVVVDSQITHDLHLNYRLEGRGIDLWMSMINVTDEDPPFTGIEMNYDAFTHNPFGRIIKMGFTYSLNH